MKGHHHLVFGSPSALWLLLGVLLVVAIDVARKWGTTRQRVFGIVARSLTVGAFVLALADPRIARQRDTAWVVFVVDRSASIPDAGLEKAVQSVDAMRASLPPDTKVGLVFADRAPSIAVMPGEKWAWPADLRGDGVESTDLGTAVDLARALVPDGDAGQIVLLSDGRPTAGERGARAGAGRPLGVPVHIVTVAPARRDASVTALTTDESFVRPGATMAGHVDLDGGAEPFQGQLVLRVDGEEVSSQPVEIGAGESKQLPFEQSVELGRKEGPLAIEAELVPDGAGPSTKTQGTVVVGQKPRVLVLAGEPRDGEQLKKALSAEAMEVDMRTVEARDFPKEVPKDTDLMIIANVPAASMVGQRGMSDELLDSIAKWVDAGGGLVVLGGPRAYDMGGYSGTPIERVLPVRLDPVDPLVEPAATIVVVLDKSGSMGEPVAASGGTYKSKMELADDGVVASLQMLRPFDFVGVATVTTEVQWDVSVQPVSDALDLEQKITRIRAGGGGIYVFTGLAAAQKALREATTPLRHVLLFSDTDDSEEPADPSGSGKTAEQLAGEMHRDGITVSVIGIGEQTDKDTEFLTRIADQGGGKFYLTNDATKLRALFVQETERLVDTSVQEVEFVPEIAAAHRMVQGIDFKSAPPLTGYQKLEPRKTAEVVLRGPKTDPILVTWRYGLGHVVSWTSDAGPRWSKAWTSWPGFVRHWTQIARFALRTRAGGATAVEVDFGGSQPIARLVRRDAAGNSLDGRVRLLLEEEGRTRELSLEGREPGLYEAKLDVAGDDVYTLRVEDEEGKTLHETQFVVPPSEEQRHRTPDEAWLRELASATSGTVDPGKLAVTAAPSRTAEHLRLWPWLTLLAALLLPLDAALRRSARAI